MKAQLNQNSATEVTLTIIADEADLQPTVRSVYNRLRQGVSAKGFRPGKAPNNVIERELGADRVQSEVIDAAASKLYAQALDEHDLQPIESPRVEVKKIVPYSELELTATVEIVPAIRLHDYKKLKKSRPEVSVTDQEVEDVVESLRGRMAERKEVKRAANVGDEVTIDFKGTKNDTPVPGAEAKEYSLLLGSNRFIPGFEEELVGLKPGEEKTFDITFPKNYSEKSLAGQKVTFEVKVHKVTELVKPEVNDDFAKEVGPFESLQDLRADIKKQVRTEKEQSAQRQFENEVLGEVVDKSELDLPPRMLANQSQQLLEEYEKNALQQGVELDEFLKQSGKTRQDIEKEIQPEAQRRVRTALVLTEVSKQESLQVTPEELEIRMQMLAGQYQDPKIQEQLQNPATRREIANQLLAEKTVAKLVDYATTKQKNGEATDKKPGPAKKDTKNSKKKQ